MSLKDFVSTAFRRKPRLTVEEYHRKLIERGLNDDGSVDLDPVPLAPPIGYTKAPSMLQMMHDMLTSHKLEQELKAAGTETLEDFEDFDIPDEPEQLRSAHEALESDPTLQDLYAAGADAKRVREEAEKRKKRPAKGGEAPEPPQDAAEDPPPDEGADLE